MKPRFYLCWLRLRAIYTLQHLFSASASASRSFKRFTRRRLPEGAGRGALSGAEVIVLSSRPEFWHAHLIQSQKAASFVSRSGLRSKCRFIITVGCQSSGRPSSAQCFLFFGFGLEPLFSRWLRPRLRAVCTTGLGFGFSFLSLPWPWLRLRSYKPSPNLKYLHLSLSPEKKRLKRPGTPGVSRSFGGNLFLNPTWSRPTGPG